MSALPTLTVVMQMLFVKMYQDLTFVHVRLDFQEMVTVAVVSSRPVLGVVERLCFNKTKILECVTNYVFLLLSVQLTI